MITCVKLIANGMSISLNVDIGVPEGASLNDYINVKKVIDYIEVNPELDFIVEYVDEFGKVIVDEYFNENINKFLYNNKGTIASNHKTYMIPNGVNPADIIIRTDNYKGEYDHIDSNIVKIVQIGKHDIAGINHFPIKYFVSKNYLLVFKDNGYDSSLDKIVYIYNELRYNNESWIKLINKLSPGHNDIYQAFQYIINSDPNSLYRLIQKVKHKTTETLSFNGTTFIYQNNHWYKVKDVNIDGKIKSFQEEVKDKDKVRELFEQLYNKSNVIHSINPIEIKDIESDLVDGDILFDGESRIYYYNNKEKKGLFKGDLEVSNESKITGLISIRNQKLLDKLTIDFSLNSKLPTSTVNYLINDLLYEFAHNVDGTPLFQFGYKTKYYEDVITIDRNIKNGDNLKMVIGIPLILGRILNDYPESFSLNLNEIEAGDGTMEYSLIGKSAIFDIFINRYNGVSEDKYALLFKNNSDNQDFKSIVDRLENEINRLDEILNQDHLKESGNKTIKEINDQLLKSMIESGELQSYCIYE